jgi:peptide/nickel transport system substrate-binding protein
MNWRIGAILVVVAVAAIVALLVVAKPERAPSGERVVRFLRSDDSKILDPQGTSSGEDALVMGSIFEELVRFKDETVDLEPGLAESWKTLQDGRVWEFSLRQGVSFHDGTPLDAAAVVFTFERLVQPRKDNPNAPDKQPYASNYTMIKKIEAAGPHLVRFTLEKPNAAFLRNLAMFPASIVSPAAVRKNPADFANQPVGTGPMKFIEWKKGDRIVLQRFDGYWDKTRAARSDRLVFIFVKEAGPRLEKLRAGQADIATNLALSDLKSIESDPAFTVDYQVSMNICYLGFNMRKPPYNDLNFRRAVAHALNRAKLIDKAYHGFAEPARTIVPPAIFKPDSGGPSYEPDAARAKEYLSKVKLPEEGIVLWVPVISRPYMPDPKSIAVSVKDDLARIGLEVKLETHPWTAYLDMVDKDDHPMFLLGWSTDNADPDNFYFALLHGSSIGGSNSSFFNDAGFNRLTEEAQTAVDAAKRAQLYTQADKIFLEQIPVLPLVHVRQAVAMRKGVRYRMHPIDTRAFLVEPPQ